MCLNPKLPKPQILESTDPRAAAAANAEIATRRSAYGYDATIQGGLTQKAQPSLASKVLLGL